MATPTTPEGRIARAQRVQAFFADEVFSDLLSRLERKYYEEFLVADTAEKRASTQGKARVLKDLEREFKIAIDDGEMAMIGLAKQMDREHEQDREQDRDHRKS